MLESIGKCPFLVFQVMFLNLLYKALKADPSTDRVKAFIKRLLQVCAAATG